MQNVKHKSTKPSCCCESKVAAFGRARKYNICDHSKQRQNIPRTICTSVSSRWCLEKSTVTQVTLSQMSCTT